MNHVLITGAKGYLGGRLMVDFAAHGYCLTGTSRGLSRPEGWPEGCALRRMDMLRGSAGDLCRMLEGHDTIVHLAAPSEVTAIERPEEALTETAVGTLRLLEAAKRAGCRRFIFLSTIHVYGSPLKGVIRESDLPRPLHPYAISHHAAEDFVLAAQARGEIEGIVVRLSNAIGAPAWKDVHRWTLIGNDLCRQAVQDGKAVLRSSGLQWRDFITMQDFVSAIGLLINAPAEKLGDGLFNLGGAMPLRMLDVAHIVAGCATEKLGHEIVAEAAPAKAGERWDRVDFAIDRMRALGFTPGGYEALKQEIRATLDLCTAAGVEA